MFPGECCHGKHPFSHAIHIQYDMIIIPNEPKCCLCCCCCLLVPSLCTSLTPFLTFTSWASSFICNENDNERGIFPILLLVFTFFFGQCTMLMPATKKKCEQKLKLKKSRKYYKRELTLCTHTLTYTARAACLCRSVYWSNTIWLQTKSFVCQLE